MAVESITVGTLVSRVLFNLTNSASSNTDLANEIKFALGFYLKKLVVDTRYNGFRKEGTKAASTQDWALPNDFLEMTIGTMRHASNNEEPLIYVTQQEYDTNHGWARLSTTTGRPQGYNIRGRDATTGLFNVRLFPTPDQSYNLVYWYQSSPNAITSATADGTELDARYPRDHVPGLIFGTCLYFPQYLSQTQQIQYKMEYEASLRALKNAADPLEGDSRQAKKYQFGRLNYAQGTWPTSIYTGSTPL